MYKSRTKQMMLPEQSDYEIIIHADDLGINNEITDKIIDCIDLGVVTSASMVCNTKGFEYAAKKYQTNECSFKLRLHINLVEGIPLSPKEKIDRLINKQGEFGYTFFTLWMKFIFLTRKAKIEFKNQIKIEILSQIRKFKKVVGSDGNIGLDSHTHIHIIPFILNIILDLSESEYITFIRLPKEKFYFSKRDIKNYFSSNMIKNILLNILSIAQQKKIKKRNIETNNHFIGVLATGRMTIHSVRAALDKLNKKNKTVSVELLFHPGGIANKNLITWTHKKAFKHYYVSKGRKKEADILKGRTLKELIEHY